MPGGLRRQARNLRGGLAVSSREVREAFDFMAGGQEELSQADVMEFMEAKFRPMGLGSLIPRDASTLVGKEPMTLERLTKMLLNNQLGAEADPTAAVFKCLANKSSGFISVETLKNLLQSVANIGELNRDDVEFLMKEVDADGDGRISLEDFAQIGGFTSLALDEARGAQEAAAGGGAPAGASRARRRRARGSSTGKARGPRARGSRKSPRARPSPLIPPSPDIHILLHL